MAELLLNDLPTGAHVLADKGYAADWTRDLIEDQDCTPHIPPRRNRYDGITCTKRRYKQRNSTAMTVVGRREFTSTGEP